MGDRRERAQGVLGGADGRLALGNEPAGRLVVEAVDRPYGATGGADGSPAGDQPGFAAGVDLLKLLPGGTYGRSQRIAVQLAARRNSRSP